MIDYSAIETETGKLTTEEKLIIAWLDFYGDKRQIELINELIINHSQCRKLIKQLINKQALAAYKKFGITFYQSTVAHQPSTVAHQPSKSPNPLKLTLTDNITNSNKEDIHKKEETASGETPSAVKTRRKAACKSVQTAAERQKPAQKPAEPAEIITDSPPVSVPAVHIGNPPINAEMPEKGDFDGLIYSADLPRHLYLHRMITTLGIGEPVKGVIGQLPYEDERFLLFKDTLNPEILREICLYREGSKWNVNYLLMDKFRDEVLHRLAFARAMSVQELADIDYWIYEQRAAASKKTPKQMNKDIKGADTHTVIIQKLRRIFWNRNWGFTFNHFLPKESFYYASESLDNAEKLCPVYCYLKKQSDEEYFDYQRERLLTAAVPVLAPAERSPRGEIQTKEQSELLHTIETLLGKGKFGMWFGESTAGISDDAVVLTVKNKFAADWVTNEFQGEVLEAAAQVCGKERAVIIAAADGKYKKTLRTSKPAETAAPQAPVKAEPLKYSEVLEQIEAKEKQAEPQKTKPVKTESAKKPVVIELTAAERAEVIDSLIDKTPNDIERALKLALVQKQNEAKHQTARPPVPALPPALPKEKPKEQAKPETPAKKQKTKEQPDAFKKLRKAFREAA